MDGRELAHNNLCLNSMMIKGPEINKIKEILKDIMLTEIKNFHQKKTIVSIVGIPFVFRTLNSEL